MNIDHEVIYKMIYQKKWSELLEIIYQYSKHSNSISPDELLINALKTFEEQFFQQLDSTNKKNDNFQAILEKLLILDKGRIYKLSDQKSQTVIIELIKIYESQGDKKKAYEHALLCPENQTCAEIIATHEQSLPQVISHSQSNQIIVTQNKNISEVDYTISLFKSKQEADFFMGVRDVYQMYVVYPNVALSCVIDFDQISVSLSKEEKRFFFRGIIDCVVFDQHDNYKPIKFFELDSSYHDLPEQKKKDNYKDKILSLAGKKLYRVRKKQKTGKKEFTQLIKELVMSEN